MFGGESGSRVAVRGGGDDEQTVLREAGVEVFQNSHIVLDVFQDVDGGYEVELLFRLEKLEVGGAVGKPAGHVFRQEMGKIIKVVPLEVGGKNGGVAPLVQHIPGILAESGSGVVIAELPAARAVAFHLPFHIALAQQKEVEQAVETQPRGGEDPDHSRDAVFDGFILHCHTPNGGGRIAKSTRQIGQKTY